MSTYEEHNPKGSQPPINESLIIDTVRIEAERQRREQQERDEKNRERQARHDRQMLGITQCLFIATLLTAIAALYQAHSSSKSANAAIEAVRISRDSRDDANRFGSNTLAEMKAQSRAVQRSADVAQDGITLARENFAKDQRPWVLNPALTILHGVPPTPGPPSKGDNFSVNVTFKNTGKSPAIAIRMHRHVVFGPDAFSHLLKETPFSKSFPPGFLGIADSSYTTAVSVKDTFANEFAVVKASDLLPWDGSMPIIVFGIICYEDLSHNHYSTQFAAQLLETGAWLHISDREKLEDYGTKPGKPCQPVTPVTSIPKRGE